MKNKPGIPNVGDTVKILEVSKNDTYYRSKNSPIGRVGVVTHVKDWKNSWLHLDIDYPNGKVECLYEGRVKILKRKKEVE